MGLFYERTDCRLRGYEEQIMVHPGHYEVKFLVVREIFSDKYDSQNSSGWEETIRMALHSC